MQQTTHRTDEQNQRTQSQFQEKPGSRFTNKSSRNKPTTHLHLPVAKIKTTTKNKLSDTHSSKQPVDDKDPAKHKRNSQTRMRTVAERHDLRRHAKFDVKEGQNKSPPDPRETQVSNLNPQPK